MGFGFPSFLLVTMRTEHVVYGWVASATNLDSTLADFWHLDKNPGAICLDSPLDEPWIFFPFDTLAHAGNMNGNDRFRIWGTAFLVVGCPEAGRQELSLDDRLGQSSRMLSWMLVTVRSLVP